tara:strand:+ start:1844 stop:2053 length:210 start_codon:yes stop_codon:yes gene_type:complete
LKIFSATTVFFVFLDIFYNNFWCEVVISGTKAGVATAVALAKARSAVKPYCYEFQFACKKLLTFLFLMI